MPRPMARRVWTLHRWARVCWKLWVLQGHYRAGLDRVVAGAAGMANEFGWAGIGYSALVMLVLYVCGAGRIMFNMGGCGCIVTKLLVSCGCKKNLVPPAKVARSPVGPPAPIGPLRREATHFRRADASHCASTNSRGGRGGDGATRASCWRVRLNSHAARSIRGSHTSSRESGSCSLSNVALLPPISVPALARHRRVKQRHRRSLPVIRKQHLRREMC